MVELADEVAAVATTRAEVNRTTVEAAAKLFLIRKEISCEGGVDRECGAGVAMTAWQQPIALRLRSPSEPVDADMRRCDFV
jgi:hypothetical protein